MPWWGSHEVKLLLFFGVVKPICFLIREVIPKKFTFFLLQGYQVHSPEAIVKASGCFKIIWMLQISIKKV